jgi:hypothetical protein
MGIHLLLDLGLHLNHDMGSDRPEGTGETDEISNLRRNIFWAARAMDMYEPSTVYWEVFF